MKIPLPTFDFLYEVFGFGLWLLTFSFYQWYYFSNQFFFNSKYEFFESYNVIFFLSILVKFSKNDKSQIKAEKWNFCLFLLRFKKLQTFSFLPQNCWLSVFNFQLLADFSNSVQKSEIENLIFLSVNTFISGYCNCWTSYYQDTWNLNLFLLAL